MKLLITGSQQHWAIENYYRKYLAAGFTEVRTFDSADRLESFLRAGIVNKVLYRTGFSGIVHVINRQLLEAVEDYKPDIVLVFKGVEISPSTLKHLQQRGVKTVNYNPDHPFIRTFRSSGGKNIEASVPLYDLHFCYSKALTQEIRERFHINTNWLPFGFELDAHTYESVEHASEINKACFVGNPDSDRARFLTMLADAGISVDVYGHHWAKYLGNHQLITICDAVYQVPFWETLRKYRVQLNLFRPHNAGSHNMRTFEVPAIGGIMLAPDTEEHRVFFESGQEAFFYKSSQDCVQSLKELLAMSKSQADGIRSAARQRSVQSDYSYRNRALQAYKKMEELVN